MLKKYLIPDISLRELRVVTQYAFLGAMLAGVYGIIHDQITFSIGHEYFHNFKFQQFAHSDFGLPDRLFVAIIGFEATWWVGVVVGWILARRLSPDPETTNARRQMMLGFAMVLGGGALGGFAGYLYGLWRGPAADYTMWQPLLLEHQVQDHWSFMRVGYIHNAGYLGALTGLVLTYIVCRPDRRGDTDMPDAASQR